MVATLTVTVPNEVEHKHGNGEKNRQYQVVETSLQLTGLQRESHPHVLHPQVGMIWGRCRVGKNAASEIGWNTEGGPPPPPRSPVGVTAFPTTHPAETVYTTESEG